MKKIFIVNLIVCSSRQIDGEDFVNFCGLLRKHELYLVCITLAAATILSWQTRLQTINCINIKICDVKTKHATLYISTWINATLIHSIYHHNPMHIMEFMIVTGKDKKCFRHCLHMGTFNNYVDRIFPFFDPPPTVCWIEVKVAVLCAHQYMAWNLLLIKVLNHFLYFKHWILTRTCSESYL